MAMLWWLVDWVGPAVDTAPDHWDLARQSTSSKQVSNVSYAVIRELSTLTTRGGGEDVAKFSDVKNVSLKHPENFRCLLVKNFAPPLCVVMS